jgi:hypothetical protein
LSERAIANTRDSVALYLGVAALIIAAGAHALVWSGGFLALPLAWLLALVAIVVADSIYRRTSLTSRSRWGLAMAVLVLGGSLVEFAVLAISRVVE